MKTTKYKNITTEQEFDYIFAFFSSWVNSKLKKSVCEIIKNGGNVTINDDTDPVKGKWDGSLTINFKTPPNAQEVVQILKEANKPDDFGMTDNKTLYLWYD